MCSPARLRPSLFVETRIHYWSHLLSKIKQAAPKWKMPKIKQFRVKTLFFFKYVQKPHVCHKKRKCVQRKNWILELLKDFQLLPPSRLLRYHHLHLLFKDLQISALWIIIQSELTKASPGQVSRVLQNPSGSVLTETFDQLPLHHYQSMKGKQINY